MTYTAEKPAEDPSGDALNNIITANVCVCTLYTCDSDWCCSHKMILRKVFSLKEKEKNNIYWEEEEVTRLSHKSKESE